MISTALVTEKLWQHVTLSLTATIVASLIGIPLGVFIYRHAKARRYILALVNVFQTIPSLALLAVLIPLLGIGFQPTIVALTIYALLPIVRSTLVGLQSVPKASIEASRALGFTHFQKLRLVELPLALPIIMSGIRTATAITIGITTIAAFIGAGGLGDFITQGLALNNNTLILWGAIPTALLALILDYVLAQAEVLLSQRKRQQMLFKKVKITLIALAGFGLFASASHGAYKDYQHRQQKSIVIASKNFTEQLILGHMIADLLQAHTHLHVIKKLNLGTTSILTKALEKGEIDLYPEYTGTAYLVVLKHHAILSATQTWNRVKTAYQKRHLTWLPPLGFNNAQTLAITETDAKKHHLHTLSDLRALAPTMTIAAPAEFIKRPDGLPGLKKAYQLTFKNIVAMQPDLIYPALSNHDVNVIEVFTTDGRIAAYHLRALEDDKHIYPPYAAAIVIRNAILKRYPNVKKALSPLYGSISNQTMQHLNYLVNVKHQTPSAVAKHYLIKKHLITN